MGFLYMIVSLFQKINYLCALCVYHILSQQHSIYVPVKKDTL